jgi:hypothetical protein
VTTPDVRGKASQQAADRVPHFGRLLLVLLLVVILIVAITIGSEAYYS